MWNYNLESCPLNTIVWLLSENDYPILPQNIYLGSITRSLQGFLTRGECYIGDKDLFYRSKIIAWTSIDNSNFICYNRNIKERR